MAPSAPTCIIADDHAIVRDGVRARLEESGYRVVGQAVSGGETLRLLREHRPSFAVVDYHLGDDDGLDVVRQARSEGIDTRFVLFTADGRRATIERAFASGVTAYIGKAASRDVLSEAIVAVLAGKTYIDPEMTSQLVEPAEDGLTEREQEVLELLGEGLSNKMIAYRLGISADTTKSHVGSIMRKLHATSRTEAVVQGYRRALLH